MPLSLLQEKLAVDANHAIPCFSGGLFTKPAIAQDNCDALFAEARSIDQEPEDVFSEHKGIASNAFGRHLTAIRPS